MKIRYTVALVLALVAAAGAVMAQAPSAPAVQTPAPPVLAPEVKAALSESMQRIGGLQYAMSILQKDLDAARAELNRTGQAAAVPGYRIDLPTLSYVPVEKAVK